MESFRLNYFKAVIEKVYSGKPVDYDRGHHEKDGGKVWIRYTITPVFEAGKVIGACINGRDVTARKLYLKNLEEQNKVFRETSWMQSHLVRAPLARIMGLIPLYMSTVDENEKVKIKEYLELSANELDNIIREITVKSNRIIQ